MKPKYRRGTRYAYMLTFSYSPLPNPPGCMKIAFSAGSFILKDTMTSLQMLEVVMETAKAAQGFPEELVIFPTFYHVEEHYAMK